MSAPAIAPSTAQVLLATLTQELNRVLAWLKSHFSRPETRRSVEELLRALLARVERKNSWGLSEQAGRLTPYAFQYLLGRARWEPHEVRDSVQAEAQRTLGPEGDCLVDETSFLKKGERSAGVAHQYSGTAGHVANCQVGVFLAYATSQGHTLIDRELYLPQEWTEDRERCRQAGIEDAVGFATKPALAQRMLERAFEAGFEPRWVLADEVYGRDGALRAFLEKRHQPYVLAVASNTPLERGVRQVTPAQVLREELRPEDFRRLSSGDGTKGPREDEWARVSLNSDVDSLSRWLLVRRSLEKPLEDLTLEDHDFFLVHAPANTSLATLVEKAGSRWPIEACFESAKQEVGLDDYEVRSWTGWYRHMTLCMVAHVFLLAARLKLNALDQAAGLAPAPAPAALPDARQNSAPSPADSASAGPQGHGEPSPKPTFLKDCLFPKVLGPPLSKGRSRMGPFLHRRGLRSPTVASNSSALASRR